MTIPDDDVIAIACDNIADAMSYLEVGMYHHAAVAAGKACLLRTLLHDMSGITLDETDEYFADLWDKWKSWELSHVKKGKVNADI